MNLPDRSTPKELARLVEAVSASRREDSLSRFMPAPAWEALATHLERKHIASGEVLIAQGARDRTLYLVESGTLSVRYLNADAELQMAALGAGSVVGEGAFFSEIPRNATVQATEASVVWALSPGEFAALAARDSQAALSVAMALGAVLATRMLDVARKVSIT